MQTLFNLTFVAETLAHLPISLINKIVKGGILCEIDAIKQGASDSFKLCNRPAVAFFLPSAQTFSVKKKILMHVWCDHGRMYE